MAGARGDGRRTAGWRRRPRGRWSAVGTQFPGPAEADRGQTGAEGERHNASWWTGDLAAPTFAMRAARPPGERVGRAASGGTGRASTGRNEARPVRPPSEGFDGDRRGGRPFSGAAQARRSTSVATPPASAEYGRTTVGRGAPRRRLVGRGCRSHRELAGETKVDGRNTWGTAPDNFAKRRRCCVRPATGVTAFVEELHSPRAARTRWCGRWANSAAPRSSASSPRAAKTARGRDTGRTAFTSILGAAGSPAGGFTGRSTRDGRGTGPTTRQPRPTSRRTDPTSHSHRPDPAVRRRVPAGCSTA